MTQEDLVEAMSSDRFPGFAQALARVGNCARRVRLRGHSTRIESTTGEVLLGYASSQEPLGVTYVRCGNRRETVCLSCSRLYAGDVFQLIRAEVTGGKAVPERVAENPLVFATLTAPSFGKVHSRRDGTGICHAVPRGAKTLRHLRARPT